VRIRTVLASIHNHDLLTVRGLYGYKPTLPAIGGSEALGVVDALATASTACRSASGLPPPRCTAPGPKRSSHRHAW
jgi:D-arabinose 1-dehydrogenase-like Zn-dependent alcohol dehydrogenase